jgi:hypothetical protein
MSLNCSLYIMNIQTLINNTLALEPYTPEFKAGWRKIFIYATHEAKSRGLNHRDQDIVKSIVDDLVFTYEVYIKHADPMDDAHAGDMSCMQSLRNQQKEFLDSVRDSYISALRQANNRKLSFKQRKDYINMARRLQSLWNEENNTNISSVPFESFELFGNDADFVSDEQLSDAELHIVRKEYRDSIHQEPECDPDDSHYVGDTTRLNRGKPRGNIGLLNGLYEQTDPEPTYQTAQGRRCMLRQLKNSDNPDDVRMFFSLTQPTRRNESDEQWLTTITKRREVMNKLISSLS